MRSAARKLIRASVCYVVGSTSPAPPQTSQRRWPVPLHSLQMPIGMPKRDFLPVPRHATQEVVLWPWHLGHKVFVGISPPCVLSSLQKVRQLGDVGRDGPDQDLRGTSGHLVTTLLPAALMAMC